VTTELPGLPALPPLFAKAILRRHTGSSVPDERLSVADLTTDADRLRRYQQLCGFRVSDVLPPTYLHLLSFPLGISIMARESFPLPLLGLIHVQNQIQQHRPVSAAHPVSVTAWAQNLRPHPAGQQLELVSEARVGAEVVWQETSTYLHRERAGGQHRQQAGGPEGRQQDEAPSRPVIQWRVPADIGRRYAAVSGDRNPIHLHNLTARLFGFRSAIAHGMWLKARTLASFEGRLPAAFTADIAFKTPVFLPSTVQLQAEPLTVPWQFDLRAARTGKLHLTGTIS
jgi:acyl dehydratase